MRRLWQRLPCSLRGHAAATDWYLPWRCEPMTNRPIDREVRTDCTRCQTTLHRRTVTWDYNR